MPSVYAFRTSHLEFFPRLLRAGHPGYSRLTTTTPDVVGHTYGGGSWGYPCVFATLSTRGAPIFRRRPSTQPAEPAVVNGTIEGRIGVLKKTGETAPCIGALVHLLLRPLDLHVVRKKATDDAGVLNPRLAHLYIDYVVSSPATQQRLAYANTRTDDQGCFAFPDLPPDRWYYIVAQALSGQVMISWQLAVHLHEGERVQVFLTNSNATLPIYTSDADPSDDPSALP